MIERLKRYVRDLPFYRRRRLWRQIVEITASEKYHRRTMEAYRQKKLGLIAEYERLRLKK